MLETAAATWVVPIDPVAIEDHALLRAHERNVVREPVARSGRIRVVVPRAFGTPCPMDTGERLGPVNNLGIPVVRASPNFDGLKLRCGCHRFSANAAPMISAALSSLPWIRWP